MEEWTMSSTMDLSGYEIVWIVNDDTDKAY